MAHRYWRIYVTKSTSGAEMLLSLFEVEMSATSGGVDLCTGGTPSASHASVNALLLFDDNLGSYWNNGAPGTDCWFQYDFGAGNAVEIGEVRFQPRYTSQCPEDFKCQWSDDNTNWSDRAAWVGETSWTIGLWNSFTFPPLGVVTLNLQTDHPYGIALAQQRPQAFDLGLFAYKGQNQTFAIQLARQTTTPFAITLDKGHTHPFGLLITQQLSQIHAMILTTTQQRSWQQSIEAHLLQPLHDQLDASRLTLWSLQSPVIKAHTQPRADTQSVTTQRQQLFELLLYNPQLSAQKRYWNLVSSATTCTLAQWPRMQLNHQPITLTHASLAHAPNHYYWLAQLTIATEADFGRLQVDDLFTLAWGDELFTLSIEQKNRLCPQPDQTQRILIAHSPASRHDTPKALPLNRSWSQAVWVKDLVETCLDETVTWELPNWLLPANRLSLHQATPIEVAKTIVNAVGGVIQSQPDGTLRLRRRFPHPPAQWDLITPDHLFTDSTDLLSTQEAGRSGPLINRVTVEESLPNELSPYLWLGIDPSPTGHNRGKTRFLPGETLHLLSLAGPGVKINTLTASTGTLMPTEPARRSATENLIFSATNQAILSRPAHKIESIIWLGNDLGALTLGADGRTITATTSGTAIARVTITLMSHGCHPFKLPNTLAGFNTFPANITAHATVTPTAIRTLTKQRNDGLRYGPTITSPLFSDPVALQARAEAELDAGEAFKTMKITTLYRAEIQPGAIIELHDGRYGHSFRGMITGITHELHTTGTFTHLELIKRG